MNSPVEISFLRSISIHRTSNISVFLQIAQQISNAIQRGYLPTGTKLPGSRSLGIVLDVHRQTIIAAYTELEAQGWVETLPNKGTYVINLEQRKLSPHSYSTLISLAQYPEKTGYSFKRSNILDNPFEQSDCRYHLNDGAPDIRLSQITSLSSMYSAAMKRKSNRKKMEKHNFDGSHYFKEQLSNYLNLTRGLHISRNNLLITRSTEMSLYIIAQLLVTPGDTVAVAELSHFSANMIFQKCGAHIQTIPLDDQGINVKSLEEKLRKQAIRLLYITPHHHYPTTTTLSAQRRVELLKLAQQYNFVIVEDDYDYDFQYEKSAVMPLASADINGMVIYIGTFGKSLAPTFRAGFVVAPANLMDEMRKYLGIIDRQGDIMMEQVLGEMIEEGDIHRHLKKSLKLYRERRDYCFQLLDANFKDILQCSKPAGGLAIWTEWNEPIPLLQLAKNCSNNNLFIPKNILYQQHNLTAIRIGFGHMDKDEMETTFEVLLKEIQRIRHEGTKCSIQKKEPIKGSFQ